MHIHVARGSLWYSRSGMVGVILILLYSYIIVVWAKKREEVMWEQWNNAARRCGQRAHIKAPTMVGSASAFKAKSGR